MTTRLGFVTVWPRDYTALIAIDCGLRHRLLVRVGVATDRPELVDRARPLFSYALHRQRADGSWRYGDASHHSWTDSFHTGFVLSALRYFADATGDASVARAVERGFTFYVERFFGSEGEPKYFPDRPYPYDIHSAAQGVLTASQFGEQELAAKLGEFMVQHFLAPDGHFRYQVCRTHRIGIPYMRWSQAWGVRALAELAAVAAANEGRSP